LGVGKISRAGENNRIWDLHILATFQALVDSIIPYTPNPSATVGDVQALGALNLSIYEYIILDLDDSLSIRIDLQMKMNTSLSKSTAQLLDAGATQLIRTGKAMCPLNVRAFPGGGPFAALSRNDRLGAITLLEELEMDLSSLDVPYQNNPGLIRNMIDAIHQLTLFGFYSEWPAYGATRLFPPDYRQIEYFPIGWIQSNYPGPAFGYRDFRGYLVTNPHKRGNG
jgi:hypothetical protein